LLALAFSSASFPRISSRLMQHRGLAPMLHKSTIIYSADVLYFRIMHPPKVKQNIKLPIHNIGSNGEGVGQYQGFTVFVDGALPGEVVEARLYQRQKRYGRANLLSVSDPSPHRVQPVCPLFGRCGGCQLMHLAYPEQLVIKRQRVVDALQRIGKLDAIEVGPCLPSPSPLAYRNKIQMPVRESPTGGLQIGLYARSSHDLVEVETCHIHCPLGEQVYKEAAPIIKQSGIKAYDPATGSGELRHILIKSAVNTGEALVILVTNGEATPLLKKIAGQIMSRCPAVKGVVHNIHTERDNVILGSVNKILEGSGIIQETLCGMQFKVSPASFFQVNPQQAEHLYEKALEFAQLKGHETVLDAYCGVGTMSLFFARQAKKVIGVECVPEAIEDAKENARLNQIQNAEFICGNAETIIDSLADIDTIILNPPRKGCEPSFLEGIGRLRPATVVYISCDSATLSRDLAVLHQMGYHVDFIQPYDMFPQTAHVECVAKVSGKLKVES